MIETGVRPIRGSVVDLGIAEGHAHWNMTAHELQDIAVKSEHAVITSTGALAVDTGTFTGRSPKDKFIVRDALTENAVWWSTFNIPFDSSKFERLYGKMLAYLNGKAFYVRDVYACADLRHRIGVRVITELASSNLFVYNMFLRPTVEELQDFLSEWLVVNIPSFKANPEIDGTRQANFSILDFTRKVILIGGTGYTGEIKKGIFTALNFILPEQQNILPMHCSANMGRGGDTAIFFGLSGTGKTTLSADAERLLIGDDEHGWTPDNVIFNFEGGCYAKTIDLSETKEPEIFGAIKAGALLENVAFKAGRNEVDYASRCKTENTRVSYPIHFMPNVAVPSIGQNPKNIFFLTCDAYGVLPPISKLSPAQAAFHFMAGYTAKVAGTEEGITEPSMTFSACFGAPFMPLHPTRYATMLSEKMKACDVQVWLVNTGWTGGSYGVGKRMSLNTTRALISAALRGELNHADYETHEVFGVAMPKHCPTVADELLNPRNTWKDKEAYDFTANLLAEAFINNFERFAPLANGEIMAGLPRIHAK